jgi:hypothetical protein
MSGSQHRLDEEGLVGGIGRRGRWLADRRWDQAHRLRQRDLARHPAAVARLKANLTSTHGWNVRLIIRRPTRQSRHISLDCFRLPSQPPGSKCNHARTNGRRQWLMIEEQVTQPTFPGSPGGPRTGTAGSLQLPMTSPARGQGCLRREDDRIFALPTIFGGEV